MRTVILMAVGWLALSSCCALPQSLHYAPSMYHEGKPLTPVGEAHYLVEACYEAIDDLLEQHPYQEDIDRVLVSTVVDINNVQRTTMFGRVSSECFSSRLTQLDKDVIHATVRADHMLVRQEGQFLLSREARNLAMDYNARTALVSTYGVTEHSVILSLKLVSTVEDSTLAGVDLVIPRTETVTEMLEMGLGYNTGF